MRENVNRQPLAINVSDTESTAISPETRLFQNVVLVAIMDAIHAAAITSPKRRIAAQAEALQWLRDGGDDFRLVCEYADLDPDKVQTAAFRYIETQQTARLQGRYQRPRLGSQRESQRNNHDD